MKIGNRWDYLRWIVVCVVGGILIATMLWAVVFAALSGHIQPYIGMVTVANALSVLMLVITLYHGYVARGDGAVPKQRVLVNLMLLSSFCVYIGGVMMQFVLVLPSLVK